MMRMRARQMVFGLALALSVAVAVPALAQNNKFPVVTGVNWHQSTPQERKAFLVGAATIIELDHEVQGATPAKNSTITAWAAGLSHFTFDQMVTAIDKWYAEHPDKTARPVIEVMWYELAKPNCPPGIFEQPGTEGEKPMPGKKAGKGKVAKP